MAWSCPQLIANDAVLHMKNPAIVNKSVLIVSGYSRDSTNSIEKDFVHDKNAHIGYSPAS